MRRRALLSGDKKDYSQEYFTMVVTVGGSVTWTGSTTSNTLSYSKNNGNTWTTANSGTAISVTAGDKVLWKGTPTTSADGIGKFSGDTDVRYSIKGNAMSLLFGDDFEDKTSLSGKGYAFRYLFSDNKNVTSAKNLSLPATTLAECCYEYMFHNCTSLTTAPELPATTLEQFCYSSMFSNCTSLTTAPELPATRAAQYCYEGMFWGCKSLTTAPSVLLATLAWYRSCSYMFVDCTSLTTAPELPATDVGDYCYEHMFQGCTSLTTAPSVLPCTDLWEGSYNSMFQGCTSLTTAPELPAPRVSRKGYYCMFNGCKSLNSIKCLATDISRSDCTFKWVEGVASRGTFTKAASMTSWTTSVDGIPKYWTVQNA